MRLPFPGSLLRPLHDREESLRAKAVLLIEQDERLQLLLHTVAQSMDLADCLRRLGSDDENDKVIRVLAMRTFNAFAASTKLVLSGYGQNGIFLMRDILETMFILGLFSYESDLIDQWRHADKKTFRDEFRPVKVRKRLETHVADTGNKRRDMYNMYSELAVHPNMMSAILMRPDPSGLAELGPFTNRDRLGNLLFELGRLGAWTGEVLDRFCSDSWSNMSEIKRNYRDIRQQWSMTFSEIILI